MHKKTDFKESAKQHSSTQILLLSWFFPYHEKLICCLYKEGKSNTKYQPALFGDIDTNENKKINLI